MKDGRTKEIETKYILLLSVGGEAKWGTWGAKMPPPPPTPVITVQQWKFTLSEVSFESSFEVDIYAKYIVIYSQKE